VADTTSLLEKACPDFYGANLWFCDPKTPVWKARQQYEIEGAGLEWRHKTMNATQACDWIERMFLSVENSVWLPEDGFELWSVFYLQRRGMDRDGVMRFARAFNAAVREKLLSPGSSGPSAPILQELYRSCQFDKPGEVSATELLRPDAYRRAEAYWLPQMPVGQDAVTVDSPALGSERVSDPWLLSESDRS
jgi:hypothetical protein